MSIQRRLTDSAYNDSSNTSDFIQRKRRPFLWQIVLTAVAAFAVIAVTAHLGMDTGITPLFLLVLGVVIGALSFFTVVFAQRSRDMVLVAEFQNALFASAAGIQTRFCLITKQDGSVVYFDPGFQRMFPEFRDNEIRSIDELFDTISLPAPTRKKIFTALEKAAGDKIIFSMKAPDGAPLNIILSMDSLQRPKGFFLFRGRDFLERRADIDLLSSASSAITASGSSLFTNMLHTLPVGVFATNEKARLIFINRPLLHWLGYEQSDIAGNPLSLRDIVYQMGDHKIGDVEMMDFIGEATLQKKSGALIKAALTQQLLRDDSGAIVGSTSIISESMNNDLK